MAQIISRTYPKILEGKKPLLVFAAAALLVTLPMLAPGYIMTLDMAFTPHLRMPAHMSSSYLFNASLHYLNVVVPVQVIQKMLLFGILLLSGTGMYYLVRHIQKAKDGEPSFAHAGAYFAGVLYMVNPFTYSRFMAGQYAVLLGYALLPFFARSMLRFFCVPTLQRSLNVSGWAVLIGIVSLHTLGPAVVLSAVSLAVYGWRNRKNIGILLNTTTLGLIALMAFIIASGYWLFPLIGGSSNQGEAIRQFGISDQRAFATAGGDIAGKLGNVLQLQGFWAEAEGLYLLPQDQLPGWLLVVLGLWVIVGTGLVWLWRRHRGLAVLFAGAGIAAIILAIFGLGGVVPALAGFREPQKFVALLALVYAVLAGMGVPVILARAKQWRKQFAFGTLVAAVALVPVLLTPSMWWGFSGQLSPRQYPADWFAMNARLNQDSSDFRVLSLPWHLYMHYPFAGRVIVNPSENFFDKPMVVSNELEYKNSSPTFPDAAKTLLSKNILPNAQANPNFGEELSELNIKYVLLAKTYDYKTYDFLDRRPDLKLVAETPNLKLYRNLAYGQ